MFSNQFISFLYKSYIFWVPDGSTEICFMVFGYVLLLLLLLNFTLFFKDFIDKLGFK